MLSKDPQSLIDELKSTHPNALRLAEVVSIAVRVEPELLRMARLNLVPEANAGDEADLWFSPLVQVRNSLGFVFYPEIARILREQLKKSGLLDDAWYKVFVKVHRSISRALFIEEIITWRALKNPNDQKIENLLLRIIPSMADDNDQNGIAQWFIRALPNLPESVQQLQVTPLLELGARLRLGSIDYFLRTQKITELKSVPDYILSLVSTNLEKVKIGVCFVEGGIELGTLSLLKGAEILELPATNPLLVDVSWKENSGQKRNELMFLEQNEDKFLSVDANEVELKTLLGDRYKLYKKAVDKKESIENKVPNPENSLIEERKMIKGELKSQVDRIWDVFWSGGISNPLEVIEQITYLLFLRRLDDLHTLEENKSVRLKRPIERQFFPEGNDPEGCPYERMRWSRFKNDPPAEMFKVVDRHVFPFLRTLGGDDSTYARHMKDARFKIPTPALLSKVVDLLDKIPMENRDTKGDLYEYMLSKIATAGQNGQFRTPRHIIRLMVEMTTPQPKDIICDPACGTAGFLVCAGEYLREHYSNILHDEKLRQHFHHKMFHGFDFDNVMLRIGSMNMLLHGVENPDIRYRDSLAQDHASDEEAYTLVLANPPFAGSLDYDNTAKNLLQIVKTKKTELLFVALFLRLLKPGGRAAVIVPEGVLFGSTNAHKELRRILVEEQKLDAVVSLPGGVFKPYSGVSTAILLFTKTNSGGTDHVWFYDVQADGWSLDDKRTPLMSEDKLGPVPSIELMEEDRIKNNLPDVLIHWQERDKSELKRSRTEQSFCVPKADIASQGYDLSLNRYKEVVHEEVKYRSPKAILKSLERLEAEIQQGIKELEGMLG